MAKGRSRMRGYIIAIIRFGALAVPYLKGYPRHRRGAPSYEYSQSLYCCCSTPNLIRPLWFIDFFNLQSKPHLTTLNFTINFRKESKFLDDCRFTISNKIATALLGPWIRHKILCILDSGNDNLQQCEIVGKNRSIFIICPYLL